jgi:membrane protein DedA with SNARE-associated domain/membrane-associated phospholipid phosphatase
VPVASISSWILSLSGTAALVVVFLVPALEASAFLGFIFPGEIAVLLGGVIAHDGRVSLIAVIVAAILGAIIGDTLGYSIGRRWGHQIIRSVGKRIPFLGHRIDEHIEKARELLRRRGGLAVFIGRFTAAARVMVPGLAGMAEMPYPEFLFFNATGGVVWATAFVLLGYAAGAAWERVAGWATRVGLALLVLVLLLLIGARVLRGLRERGESLSDRLARIGPVADLRGRFPRAAGWLARRVEIGSPRGFLLSLVTVVGFGCGWLAGAFTQDAIAHEEAVTHDPGVERWVIDHRDAWLTPIMKLVTWLGSDAVLVPLVVLIGVTYVLRRQTWRPMIVLAVSLGGTAALIDGLKPLIDRPRPPDAVHLIAVSGASFPSSHAAAAAAVLGALGALFATGRSMRSKVWIWTIAGVLAVFVAYSRLYLGASWWTDVIAGLAIGGAWLCAIVAGIIVLTGSPAPIEAVPG